MQKLSTKTPSAAARLTPYVLAAVFDKSRDFAEVEEGEERRGEERKRLTLHYRNPKRKFPLQQPELHRRTPYQGIRYQ